MNAPADLEDSDENVDTSFRDERLDGICRWLMLDSPNEVSRLLPGSRSGDRRGGL